MGEKRRTYGSGSATAAELVASFKSGDLSVPETVTSCLRRADDHRSLNALTNVNCDQVHAAARQRESALARGEALGPVFGIPIVVKDNIDVAGLPTTANTPGLQNHMPQATAPAVQRLLDGGAIVLGKANMHELAMISAPAGDDEKSFGPFGRIKNPLDSARIPGGTSGGSAAAVAAGIVPVALGTDTGASVRNPAAFCGVVGFRPTTGRYPRDGIVGISSTRDTIGPLATTVADAILFDKVLAMAAGAPTRRQGSPRLGLPRSYFFDDLDSEVREAVELALGKIEAAGAQLIPCELVDVEKRVATASYAIAMYEAPRCLERYLRKSNAGPALTELIDQIASPSLRSQLLEMTKTAPVPDAVYAEAINSHRRALQQSYRAALSDNGLDALIFPTCPSVPRVSNGQQDTERAFFRDIRNCRPASMAGVPALTIPTGGGRTGLPVGLEIDGHADRDEELLSVGLWLEQVLRS